MRRRHDPAGRPLADRLGTRADEAENTVHRVIHTAGLSFPEDEDRRHLKAARMI